MFVPPQQDVSWDHKPKLDLIFAYFAKFVCVQIDISLAWMLMPEAEIEPTKWDLNTMKLYQNQININQ